ncbi:hypothetical protein BGZ74_000337, partial [Mortierella antarctica]
MSGAIENSGTDCFINSAIQALRGIECFRQLIYNIVESLRDHGDSVPEGRERVMYNILSQLHLLMKELDDKESAFQRTVPPPSVSRKLRDDF